MKMRYASISLVIIIVATVGWYLFSPLLNNIVLNEPSPVANMESLGGEQIARMREEIRMEFEKEMDEMSGKVVRQKEQMPGRARVVATVPFEASAHEVEGKALLIEDGEKYYVRFEDFKTINGPDLHIYLSKDLKANNYLDLGQIKATEGNVNYEVPEGVDTTQYKHILVWCEPFRVLFSYAILPDSHGISL